MLPPIIQGGMGVGVSGWRLAGAVSQCGQLGVVSGTAIDLLLTRQLQLGDLDGHLRRALDAFPYPEITRRILERYFIPSGKESSAPFKTPAMISHEPSITSQGLTIASSFVAIYLAKEGHGGLVGLNLLEKIQTPTLLALYGAMLAQVDVVLMGAGIPRQIPKILDELAAGHPAEMRLDVTGGTEPVFIRLDPNDFGPAHPLKRPLFLAIVSSPVLAENLRRKASGRVDGFVVEASMAGGHNAPPRGAMQLTAEGEPIYGERDRIDPAKFCEIGLPFWLAGGYGRIGKLREAQALGAKGIQVGTAFALCEESGFDPDLKKGILESVKKGELNIHTDAFASPTGFPFKVARLDGSVGIRKPIKIVHGYAILASCVKPIKSQTAASVSVVRPSLRTYTSQRVVTPITRQDEFACATRSRLPPVSARCAMARKSLHSSPSETTLQPSVNRYCWNKKVIRLLR